MSTERAVALIGFAGALAGALINTYSAELKAPVLGHLNRNKDLVGEWVCIWAIPEKHSSIQDTVTIEKISGEAVRAVAHTPSVGKYRLAGRISQSSLLTFFRPLGGVIILELNAVRNEMFGYWQEYRACHYRRRNPMEKADCADGLTNQR